MWRCQVILTRWPVLINTINAKLSKLHYRDWLRDIVKVASFLWRCPTIFQVANDRFSIFSSVEGKVIQGQTNIGCARVSDGSGGHMLRRRVHPGQGQVKCDSCFVVGYEN